ncbi:MAG: helix-turn-helix transcriptional regulator [Pseudonocardiaceae bacterium]
MASPSDPAGARSRAHSALASPSRVHILDLLRGSGTPLDVAQIAAQSALHPNTVRFHLRVLVEAGLTRCRTDPRGHSGRPRLVYTATTDGSGSQPDGFQLLADILASYLAASSTTPTGLAEEAGRAFARRHRQPSQPFAGVSADEAVRHVTAMFAELGFQPELQGSGSHRRILLHACPFRAIASKHPDVVCAVHLGLLRQTLANLGAPVEASGLEPFVTPRLCVAHLAPAREPATPSTSPDSHSKIDDS